MQYKNSHTLSISLRVHIHAKLALYQLYLLLLMLLVDCTGSTDLPLFCLEIMRIHISADAVAVGFDGRQFEKTSATNFCIKSLVEQNQSPSSDRAS